ncbi:MAG TPA: T9SS type A sorting domain-containing protein [Caldithrix abyssi]|uniref:T9SS type A sorting domain-containing protein n=1 Tax=Caldithrix abyssi TaxID=187145 RepID=A0A7V1LP58_CALAY|nr:T9SS type A sorting domain-containing protein [Caldithrix abyssi]
MNKLLTALVSLFLLTSLSMAQVWTFDRDFADMQNPHGVVITPDGKIWTANYSKTDTMVVTEGDTLFTNPIYIYAADGTLETTLRVLNFGATKDTLSSTCRGISLDNDGNILYTHNDKILQINYQNHELMNKFIPSEASPLTEAAATDDGYFYVAHVLSGKPFYIFDDTFELFSFVTDTFKTLQRSVIVSPDGNDIYTGSIYSGYNGVRHIQSIDGSGAESEGFAIIDTFGTIYNDTLVHQMWAQCLDWDNNGLIWVGTYWDVDSISFTGWYALDPTQNYAVVDTLGHNFIDQWDGDQAAMAGTGTYLAPRGIAFSADGKTAYTADFDGGWIKTWKNDSPKGPGSSIIPLSDLVVTALEERGNPQIAVSFELKQNYPNPFNPSTTIPFTINATKHVTLKVYDVNGRLIETLIDQQLAPRQYEYKFDGTNLASGTYFYQLNVDGQLVNKTMLLVK